MVMLVKSRIISGRNLSNEVILFKLGVIVVDM